MNRYEEPDAELFRNPAAEYRGIPFWSWNCRITKELIDAQLPVFQKMGFGGVNIHPRTGLDIDYLGEEYLELVKYTVEKCRELGLFCWLYDDDRFPSGAADGIVTRNQSFRGRFLLLTEKKRSREDGYFETKEKFDRATEAGADPAGYYVTAYGLAFENGYLKSYRRLQTEAEILQSIAQGDKIRYAYVELMPREAWFQDQAYVDTMNPQAIAEFIRVTHEAYFSELGEEFGKTVPAIFTDEPRLGKHKQLSYALSDEDVTLPYTDYFARVMKEEQGIDALDIVPEYIWDMADESFSVNRYLYRNMTAECFVRAYMDRIADWCREHHIAMTGHVLSEDSLGSQVFALGDCMRCYRSMELPGIDILCDQRELIAVKQAVSVSRQNGKAGCVSELYGVTHWDCDFKTFKLQGDWQAALGITVRVPHLSHMSLQGEAKRDWPGSIFFQAPWYEKFSYLEDHFARLNTVLTGGKAEVRIGVIHPVESMWLYMGPDERTMDIRREMDEDFYNLVSWLLYGTLDFDFLSEALLPEQCQAFFKKKQAGGPITEDEGDKKERQAAGLKVGQMEYSVILVPGMTTIRSTTLELLEDFSERGGTLVFMGRIPELTDACRSDRAYRLAEKSVCIGKSRTELYAALEPFRDVEIVSEGGTRADNLFYQLRSEEYCKWLYICHVNPKEQHISDQERYVIRIKGCFTAALYDTVTGEITEALSQTDGEYTFIVCGLYAEDSALYQLKEQAHGAKLQNAEAVQTALKLQLRDVLPKQLQTVLPGQPQTVAVLQEIKDFYRQEQNVLLLDYAEYRVDDGMRQDREEILKLDNRIRKQLGFALRKERMSQPYHLKEKELHKVTLYYHIRSRVSVPVMLALEEPGSCRIWLNGEEADRTPRGYYVDPAITKIMLPALKKGDNELVVEVAYHQKTNLENMYLLGDFDVELEGSSPVITAERSGLHIGDITGQGMPFYTGNLDYTFAFETEDEDGEYYVQIPHFKAPLLAVSVDGEEKGLIALAPHRKALGRLKKGMHELRICLYGNRFNSFGTLHNANDAFKWYGPDAYRTTGEDWTDCYRVRPVGLLSAVEIQKK